MRLTLFVDHACNLACSYCYNGEKFRKPMSLSTARKAVDLVQGMDSPLRQVSFFGGEPLLQWDLIQEVTAYVRGVTEGHSVAMAVTTNGTLLTDPRLEWMRENAFHVGVSLDGCEEAHNATRPYGGGAPSAMDVTAGVRRLLSHGLPLKTVSVIDPANVDFLGQSFQYLLDLGVRDMSFNINYEGAWDDAARERFQAALERLSGAYVDAYSRGLSFKLNLLDSKIVTHVKMGFSCKDRCDFGCAEIAVSPSGRLYPCDRLVGEDSNDAVVIGTLDAGVDIARRDRLVAEKNRELEECLDCDIVQRCMHWCGCVNYAMTGSVGEVDGLLCWFEQTVVLAADQAAEILYREANPGFLRRFYGGVQ
jgi:uncharacterized protein